MTEGMTPEAEALQKLARKYARVTGSEPVGLSDTLSILAVHCRSEFEAWLDLAFTQEERGSE